MQPEHRRDDGQFERRGEVGDQVWPDRALAADRVTPVALQQPAHVGQILLGSG